MILFCPASLLLTCICLFCSILVCSFCSRWGWVPADFLSIYLRRALSAFLFENYFSLSPSSTWEPGKTKKTISRANLHSNGGAIVEMCCSNLDQLMPEYSCCYRRLDSTSKKFNVDSYGVFYVIRMVQICVFNSIFLIRYLVCFTLIIFKWFTCEFVCLF